MLGHELTDNMILKVCSGNNTLDKKSSPVETDLCGNQALNQALIIEFYLQQVFLQAFLQLLHWSCATSKLHVMKSILTVTKQLKYTNNIEIEFENRSSASYNSVKSSRQPETANQKDKEKNNTEQQWAVLSEIKATHTTYSKFRDSPSSLHPLKYHLLSSPF